MIDKISNSWLYPDWSAPANVLAISTSRKGGVILIPYHTFNVGSHTGDDTERVAEDCARLIAWLKLPGDPV